MQVVFVASNLEHQAYLDFEQELTALQQALDRASPVDGRLRVYPKLDATQLLRAFNGSVDLLAISAHGDGRSILMANGGGGEAAVSAEAFTAVMRGANVRPRLILLNACTSFEIAEALVGAADFVIGTTAEVTDRGAIVASATLVELLGRGRDVQRAFDAADALLQVVDRGACTMRLYSATGSDPARAVLVETFRIVAAFPDIDAALENNQKRAPSVVDEGAVSFEFGVAGAPSDLTQLVLFTDDASFIEGVPPDKYEERLSWIVREAPVEGEIWIDDPPATIYGDCRWFACGVGSDGRLLTASASAVEALRRYYFEEAWQNELPPAYSDAVRTAITYLSGNRGARRRSKRD